LHVSKDVVVPEVGCAVTCCGLKIGTYLNGELGEVISFQNKITEFRLEVCFENKDFGSKMVKLENLQIATHLPGTGEVEYGEGWEEPGNLWGENGIGNAIGEEPYEAVNEVERGRRSTMRLLSLRADCDEYMVSNIDAVLHTVNIFLDIKAGIVAERTATKMANIYCRINGPEHNNAKRAKAMLEKCKKRYIILLEDGVNKKYQVDLQLYNNVQKLIIIGPITDPRNIANEKIMQLRQDHPTPCKGCPVICHGLVNNPHLNGELGVVTTYRHDVGSEFQIQVFFEKKQLKSVWVNRKHLQVAFELPRRAMERLNPNHMPWIGEDCISQIRFLIEAGLCSDLDV